MAMPFHGYVDNIKADYALANSYLEDAVVDAMFARLDFDAGKYNDALDDIIDCGQNASTGANYLVTGGALWNYMNAALTSLWEYDHEPATVDMAGIINAMLVADPEQIEYFVGLVDAFRQSVWNKPFNREFYAALARGFMEWP